MIKTKTQKDIERMRISGKILAGVFDIMKDNIRPGVTTKFLDKLAHEYILKHDAKPSFLGYSGFPASICTSVDSIVVHGIPSETQVLEEGQIIGIDVGVQYKGLHTDAARTFAVGKISEEKQRLIDVTEQSFFEGLKGLKAGSRIGDIGGRIQTFVEKHGFSVVRDLVGHGVGHNLHEDPAVPNYGLIGSGQKLPANCTLAIEPMVNVGTPNVRFDGMWNVETADKRPSAHYENTILITDEGIEILTKQEDN